MKPAYCELYVEDAQDVIPESFSFATYYLKLSLEEYVEKFLAFEYIHLIEEGNPHYLSGMSGIELAAENRKYCSRKKTLRLYSLRQRLLDWLDCGILSMVEKCNLQNNFFKIFFRVIFSGLSDFSRTRRRKNVSIYGRNYFWGMREETV